MSPFPSLSARALGLLLLALLLGAPARAQEAAETTGTIRGKVIDSETSAPAEDVKVTLVIPAVGDAAAREELRNTDANGEYEFNDVPPGSYTVKFAKSGYRASTMTNFTVQAGQENRADFPLPPLPPQAAEEMPGFEEFVVEASPMEEILAASRMESDEMLNTLSAAEFAKFAASDVADALKFVPGVNVVDGQFAVIRGLEDRYSSTLYNSAVVPSPDPDSQSVQLDLFPSDIVTNLIVAKTFAPDLPSNSSGGSINILTNDYPESFEVKLSAGTGYNSNAINDYLEFNGGTPMGTPRSGSPLESDFSFSIGGRGELAEREIRYKAVAANEIDYDTAEGTVGAHEPKAAVARGNPQIVVEGGDGDLSLEELSLSGGTFDSTVSEQSERLTGYAGFGFDFDTEAKHRIDGTYFYTRARDKAVQLYENGHIEGFDYGVLADLQANAEPITSFNYQGFATLSSWLRSVREFPDGFPSQGPLWSASFAESNSFDIERDLVVYQVNGDHTLDDLVDGLHFSWAANTARTTQKETSYGTRFFFEPTDTSQIPTKFPAEVDALGPGAYFANSGILFSDNDIHERQDFVRVDADYQTTITPWLSLRLDVGYWYERADRDVAATFLENALFQGGTQFSITGPSAEELGENIFDQLDKRPNGDLEGNLDTTSKAVRDIQAWGIGSKVTLWEDLDLLAGARFESILIESNNDPFTGETNFDGTEGIFPGKYLFFERLDNPARGEVGLPPPPGTIFNDQILGIDVPIDPETGFVDLTTNEALESLINGKIDEDRVLPSYGFTYRALEGLNIRGAYSQTVARPSFREMGYYLSVEPGSDDLIIGNPQMKLSDVESFDARVEYVWGEVGDLGAVSGFYKTIEDPIESIIVRNPADFTVDSGNYRTFFNNPNQAKLWGIELEARKNLGFIGPEIAQYFSIGGNYTYIWATVDRTEAELARSQRFFGVAGEPLRVETIDKSRRLFGQPEWIANVDFTFDQPDWGTKVTLSYFAISSLLDAAGSATISTDGLVQSMTLDRYLDSYDQLNLVMSQSWPLGFVGGDVTLKGNVKNLTDSKRRVIYDQEQTNSRIAEREFKVGLDYSLSLTYSLSF